jgi:hypothetical protein
MSRSRRRHRVLDGSGVFFNLTGSLLKNIAATGVEIEQAMTLVRAEVNEKTHTKQPPWGNTNLLDALHLNPQPAAAEPK